MKKTLLLAVLLFSTQYIFSQREYSISVPVKANDIISGHLNLGGSNPAGNKIDFNSFYMTVDNKPFIPVMGEMHYSRLPHQYWEEQILKMKAGGINVIATYVFWNIHETEEGIFDWKGDKDLRRFLDLCRKHDMYTIVRVGPFCHGEIRNGGLPDWLYGRPFEVRSDNDGYLFYVKRLYHEIGAQLRGLYYKDGGSLIGIQLENELQHSASLWAFHYPEQSVEWTTANYDAGITKFGVSVQEQETAFAKLGSNHLATLKRIAIEEGMIVPLYTVTGWGNAAILENEAIPVTAAYPYPSWAEPELSELFLFKDIQRNPDYSPVRYDGARYPSFCAEMGVGIQMTYARRPVVSAKGAEALMLRSLGSGANGIGYYMYHGGLTPQHKGVFLSDELGGVPKISYDFQAPLGEYGKTKESYFNLRIIHHFVRNYMEQLAPMKVYLPETNSRLKPDNKDELRYAVRSDGKSGFVFLHNFQDHDQRVDQKIKGLNIRLDNESIQYSAFTLEKDNSVILPFNMAMGSCLLKYSTAQPLVISRQNNKLHYYFYAHDGISPEFVFDKETVKGISRKTTAKDNKIAVKPEVGLSSSFVVTCKDDSEIIITTLTRQQALHLNQWKNNGKDYICITDATLIQDGTEIRLQSRKEQFLFVMPTSAGVNFGDRNVQMKKTGLFTEYKVDTPPVNINFEVKEANSQRYTFRMDKKEFSDNLSDIILDIDYIGDICSAFIDGRMINDHFYQGKSWQIGLKQYAGELSEKGMYFYFKPMSKNMSYWIDLDNIPEFEGNTVCKVNSIRVIPEYCVRLNVK